MVLFTSIAVGSIAAWSHVACGTNKVIRTVALALIVAAAVPVATFLSPAVRAAAVAREVVCLALAMALIVATAVPVAVRIADLAAAPVKATIAISTAVVMARVAPLIECPPGAIAIVIFAVLPGATVLARLITMTHDCCI